VATKSVTPSPKERRHLCKFFPFAFPFRPVTAFDFFRFLSCDLIPGGDVLIGNAAIQLSVCFRANLITTKPCENPRRLDSLRLCACPSRLNLAAESIWFSRLLPFPAVQEAQAAARFQRGRPPRDLCHLSLPK
jgi:hypothetical protein